MRNFIYLFLFFVVCGLFDGCKGMDAKLDNAKQTVDLFYKKMSHHDYDSLSAILSKEFLAAVNPEDLFHDLDSIDNENNGRQQYRMTGFEHTIKNSKQKVILTYEVKYANKISVEQFTLVPENDTMKIFYFVQNP